MPDIFWQMVIRFLFFLSYLIITALTLYTCIDYGRPKKTLIKQIWNVWANEADKADPAANKIWDFSGVIQQHSQHTVWIN